MGSIFRSERMTLVQTIVQNDAKDAFAEEFGAAGIVEFRDLNSG